MKLKIFLLIQLFIALIAANADEDIKIRLPQSINSFQPAIVPVANFDETIIFFDRKFNPENKGGVYDKDDIWYSVKKNKNFWSLPKNIEAPINTKYSDVLFSMSPDGKKCLLYGDYSSDIKKDGFSISEFDGTNFSKPKALNIKNFYNDSTVYYGFLSPDGNILLMSLSRKDSYGGLDLYISFYDKNSDSYTEPMNMGQEINSIYDETAPFLAYNNKTLYFSSKKQSGGNNYDIFISEREADNWKKWSSPKNLGKLINSNQDENSFYLNAMGNTAYIAGYDTTTKRKGIYKVNLPDSLSAFGYFYVKGSFYELKYNIVNNINADITLKIANESDTSFYFNKDGKDFIFPLVSGSKYVISIEGDEFYSSDFIIESDTIIKPRIIEHDFEIKRKKATQTLTQDEKYTIYYDYDDSKIQEKYLGSLLEFMNKYPKEVLEIRIIGYSCDIGTEEYNKELSKARAENVKKFLIDNGFSSRQISVIGVGESNTETKKELNRKCDIIIRPFIDGRRE